MSNNYEAFLIERCRAIFLEERTLLEEFSIAQETVRNAVFMRDWQNMEAMLSKLNHCSTEFTRLERDRAEIFSFLHVSEGSGGFYTFLAVLPAEERKELAELYRNIKLEALKIRMANDSLNHYLRNARSTVSEFLEAAFPDRRGKMYTRHGTSRHADVRSLLVNKHL